jgi:hypothetical protein
MAIIMPGSDLSQPAGHHGVVAMAAHGELDRIGDHLAATSDDFMP